MRSGGRPLWGVVTAAEMAAIDREAVEECRIPPAALMERAGTEVARAVERLLEGRVAGARVHVLCGGGNNGGDGFVAARCLANWGARVRVTTAVPPDRLKGEPLAFYTAALKAGVHAASAGETDLRMLSLALKNCDVVVDALLGTGARGPLRSPVAEMAEAVNEAGRPVVAVDIPTGVDADTGKAAPAAVRAAVTVTFGLPKVGHLFYPGKAHTGELVVADIGFPVELLARVTHRILAGREWAAAQLVPRPPHGHKGTFGRVVVVAGSRGMAGAAALAAQGALRSGAGLVTWMGPESQLPLVQSLVPEATARALAEQEGGLAEEGAARALEALRDGDAVAIGPGLGGGPGVDGFVLRFLEGCPCPAVIDADALNAIARRKREVLRLAGPRRWIFTPHVKEAARLLGTDAAEVAGAPWEAAERLAEEFGCTVVLKGAPTVIRPAAGGIVINGSGDVSLATGGTGDVLTGVIASLLAQGYPPQTAAALGAYVHGRAGELAGSKMGRHGALASDVARAVAAALAELERG